MTEDKVEKTISQLLVNRFKLQELVGVDVRRDEDFGGEPILRATATFRHRPKTPPAGSVDVIGAIQDALQRQGEERFLILSDKYLDEPEPEEEG